MSLMQEKERERERERERENGYISQKWVGNPVASRWVLQCPNIGDWPVQD